MTTEFSTTLMNLIISANVEGLSAFVKDLQGTMEKKLFTYNQNNKILDALTKAGFDKSEEFTNLFKVNSELGKELDSLNDIRYKAIEAIKVLN